MPPLPQIDISPFLPPSSQTPSPLTPTTNALNRALTPPGPGFFYLTHHSIPTSLTTALLSQTRHFFSLPPAQKAPLRRRNPGDGTGDGARGYQRLGENVTGGQRDRHEALDWYRPVLAGEPLPPPLPLPVEEEGQGQEQKHEDVGGRREPPYALLQGMNAWPSDDEPAGFRDLFEGYVERMLELGTAVVRAMAVALGVGDGEVFVRATRESWWVMRAIAYPALPMGRAAADDATGEGEGEGEIGCGAHTDYGCVTILLMDETEGALQVWMEGEGWVAVPPVPGAFVVNVGDMMERWTNGIWKSTRHRVVHRGGGGMRVSVPFFFEPDFGAWVEPLEECVERVGERRFDGVRYGNWLEGKVRGNFGDG